MNFNEEQIKRYSRHIILPEVGGKGQEKINNASVFLVGAGGLGSPSAYFLAAAGVGKIGIADDDAVELSNLQRQIIHSTSDVGKNKALSAKETIEGLNRDVEVVTYQTRVNVENIEDMIKDYDIVLDGSDNFNTRFLVNDACVFQKKPLISGAVFRFEGQLTTIVPGDGPCYRCLYKTPPPAGLVPSCMEAGVLGVLPGVIGVLQATEALKYIVGIGDPLKGRLLIYDALDMDFKNMSFSRNPECAVCGDNPTLTTLSTYEESCSL